MGTVSGTWLALPTAAMETELFAACTEGDVSKAKELLKKETKETIDQVDFYGYTALHAACEAGHADLIVPLLEAGADINRATYDATFTSLHHALAKAKWDCARILIEKGADLDVLNEGGCFGSSLHYAVYQGNEEFVKLILSKGADVNSISGQGYTPLHMAVINSHDALVPILIKGGADLDTADEVVSPLFIWQPGMVRVRLPICWSRLVPIFMPPTKKERHPSFWLTL